MSDGPGWTRRLAAIASTGLEYSSNPFDIERYKAVHDVAAEIAAQVWGVDVPAARALFAREGGHTTPKVDVRGGVFRDDAVLLVKERDDGLWSLPGGWAEPDESPSEALVREVLEESGFHTRPLKLAAALNRTHHDLTPYPFSVYMLLFVCEVIRGSPTTSVETESVGFFRSNELPELSRYRVTLAQVECLFEHHRHPERPADFD